ncbi:hypothetical protein [Microvirga rosea]|uniref:hypothetical protein n=1 Tax=Microvirga rosea TaxID=2715425 RepID=UPI001D0A46C0|nr:hypothetical protein [Microvirga rosea]MCB8822120.1 hypothetical protein [Microvirga rosea]
MSSQASFSRVLIAFDNRALQEIRLAIRAVQTAHPRSHLAKLAMAKLRTIETVYR